MAVVSYSNGFLLKKKGKRKVQGVPQSQTAALPKPQEEEETDKPKQALLGYLRFSFFSMPAQSFLHLTVKSKLVVFKNLHSGCPYHLFNRTCQ